MSASRCRRLLVLGTALAAYGLFLLLLTTLSHHLGLAYNRSASLPRGLYLLGREPVRPHRLALVCLPRELAALALSRGYLGRGACPGGVLPLGKIVLATAGDRVTVTAAGLFLNGRPVPASRPQARDGAGRPLHAYRTGSYRLRRGEIWLFSPYHPLSWDSRYYGPLPASTVLATVRPLVIFERSPAPAGFRLRRFASLTY